MLATGEEEAVRKDLDGTAVARAAVAEFRRGFVPSSLDGEKSSVCGCTGELLSEELRVDIFGLTLGCAGEETLADRAPLVFGDDGGGGGAPVVAPDAPAESWKSIGENCMMAVAAAIVILCSLERT